MNVIVRACVILAVMGGTLADLTSGPGGVAVDDSGCPAQFATSLRGGFNGILASEVRAATEFLAANLGGDLTPTFGNVREFAVQMFSPEATGVICVRLSARLEQRQDNFQIVPPITEDDILSVLNSSAFDDCIETRECTDEGVPMSTDCEPTSVGFSGNGANHGYAVEVLTVATGACDNQIPGGFLRCDETSPVSRNLVLGDLMCAYDPNAGITLR